jgi:lipid-A-disaccharide synthase
VSRHVFLVAAEDSGDALGADVIDALRSANSTIQISGIGGARMADRGVASTVDMSGLAVLGFVDGIKAYKRVKQAVEAAGQDIIRADPDAVVLIDSWGFMWRLARHLKLAGARAKRIKLIGPQVWATRPGRARVLAKWVDHLLCIFDVEEGFYKRWGLPTTVIGNPALGRLQRGDGAAFRKLHDMPPEMPILGLLPGSRPSEIQRVAPTLIEACTQLCAADRRRHVLCIVAPSVAPAVRALAATWPFPHTLSVSESEKADAFAAMDVAIACSGTVTTELAAQGAAMVVGYRLGWVTWALARLFLWKSRYMSLVNVAAGREVAPEFLQTRFSADSIVPVVERLLSDPAILAAQKKDQAAGINRMAGTGKRASVIAAETILAPAGA